MLHEESGAPRDWTQATPWVTCSVWPSACLCHAVRAPGANRTFATTIRWPSWRGYAMGSSQTSLANCSGGFLLVGTRASTCTEGSFDSSREEVPGTVGHDWLAVSSDLIARRSSMAVYASATWARSVV